MKKFLLGITLAAFSLLSIIPQNVNAQQCAYSGQETTAPVWPTISPTCSQQQLNAGQGNGSYRYYYIGSALNNSYIDVFLQPQCGSLACARVNGHQGGCCDNTGYFNCNNTWATFQGAATSDYILVTTQQGGAWCTSPNGGSAILYYKWSTPGTPALSGATTVCASTNSTYSFSGTANTTSYSWGTPTTISGTATATLSSGGGNSTSATYSFSGSGVVRLSATSSNNGKCTSTGTIDVTVNAISTAPTSITASQGYTTACGGQAVTLSVNGGSLGYGAVWRWYSGSCGGTLVASGVSSITVAPTSTTTYFVRAEGTCNTTTCASYTLTYQTPQGDPTVFGDNVWRAYAFRDQNFKDYGGFYTDTRLSFDVPSRWNTSSAPSSANASNGAAYSGCTISDDYHSVVYKRKGFPCGRYRLDIPNYDDDTYLFVNGVQVWSNATGCCAAVTNAWTGYLDANSTVEYRWREGVGASDAGLTFNLLSSSLNFGTPVVNCDASNTGCITVTPSGGTPPYLINIGSNFGVNSGKYRDITITSSAALTNYQVQISVPFYAGAKSDFSDYRFYDANGNLIPYWRESFTASSSAIFWVKVPTIANGTTTIRLTYGNTDANLNTTSSPHETFELFDDFNSANNSYDGLGADWITGTTNATSGTIFSTNSTGTTISTGRLSGGNQNRFLRSRKSFVGNYSVETRTLETSPATNGYTTNGFYLNATTGISFLSHNGTGYVRTDNAWPNPGGYLANVFVREAIKCVGTSANVSRIRQDNSTSILNVNYTVNGLNGHFVRLGARGDDGNYDQNFSATWDWIFVRKSTTTEPSISIGIEQSSNQFCGLPNNSTQSVTVRDNVGCTVTQNVVIPALPSVPSVDGITTTVNVNKCGGSTIPLTPGSGANTCRVYNGIPPTAGGSGTLIASGSSYAFTSSQTVYITSYNSTTGCESAGGLGVGYVQVNITVSPSFTFTVSTTQPSCNGGSNGTATATLGTPGTSPYTFNWSGGNAGGASFGVARTGFTAGNYQVTVNDNAGCQAVQTFTISEPSIVQITNATLSNYNGFNVSCNGSNNGSISLTVSGGTGGYTYTWSPNVSTSANANSLSAGTYNVTVRDANLCSATASYTLSQPNLLAPSVAIGYGCGGATYTNSTIVVTPAGGVPNYSYQFSGGTISGNQTTVTSNGLYGYTVTDANNCSVSGSANVTQIGQPVSANDACNAIYVSSSGVSSASGTKSCPTTLVNALTLLSASRNKILIEGATFNISQKLVIPVIAGNPAITIEGGYNVSGTTWIKTSNQKTILNITSAEENPANNIAHRIGISAVGVSNFTLQDLTVNVTGYSGNSYVNGTNTSASQGFGKSVYGIYVNNCSNYNIVRCAVTVGNATAGSPGSPGSAGANGGNGGNGQTAYDGCAGIYYAPGGSSSCSSGGTGGSNSNCSYYPAGGSPGAGGACGGGAGSDNCNNTACSNPGAGGRGCDGVDGADQGQAAAGGSGSISSGFWLPGSQGATGANGGNGTGGGGGGGGGASYGGICYSRSGGSGGGGGGAGCGGTGGTGGFGGGSAYAIFTNGNSGTNNVIDCSLTTGSAGAGGVGGVGGSGGSRGFGGIGGASVNCETARGGDGGNGGRGGNGGQGGNGQAGEAVTLKIVSGSVNQSGTSVPNASDPVTVDADQGCTNSIITVTKSLSAGNFNIPSGASIVNDLNSSTPSTTVAGPTMYVTFASGQLGKKDLVAGSTTYRNYYDIRYDRTLPTMSISDLNPCRNTPITLTCTNDGSNPSGNPVTYEWQIISGVTPSNPSSGIVNAQSTTHTFTAVGTYQVRLRVKVSCCGWSAPIYQTINVQDVPANATSITQGIPVACQNQNGVTYTVGAVSGATSYNWTVTGGTIAAGQGTSQITVNWGGGTSGTVSVRPANSCGNSPAPYSINVTLNGNPTASINPTPVTADFCAGGSVTLQGGATSGGGAGNGTFSYAWSTSQLIQTISVNSANTYYLTVTEGGSGCKGITSINVTQLSPPSITTHPANSGVCEQTNTSFTVAATGAGLTYQWQVSTDGGGTWNNITAAGSNPTYSGFNSSATLNLNGVVNANNGWRYRVIVSGTCSPSVTSNAAILTVNPAPTISQSPQASTICNGDNTSFTVTASGFGPLSYQWQVNDGGGWANITAPGSNPTYGGYNSSNTLTLTGAPTAVNGYNYRVVVSGGCAPSATSSPATLTVNPTSVGGTAGTTGNGPTICTGGTTTLLLGGNTGSVQWQDSPDGTNWTNIPGATSTLYNTPVLTADRYYRAIVTSGVCPSATSTVQLISVKNSIAGTASSDQTICTGSQPANISLTGFNGAIQWQQADDAAFTTGLINIPGGTNSTLTGALIGVLTSTKYFRAQVTDFPCGTVSSNTVTVTVSPLTVAGNVTGGNSPICEGGNTGVMTLSGNTGSVVKWQKRVNSGAWTDIANTALTYSEVPTSSGTWDYRAVVQSGACAAANSTFTTIVVNAAPAITILPQGNDTLGCNNDIFVLNTSISGGGGGAISYQWAEYDYGNNSYTNIGGATNATYTTVPLVNLDNTNDAFYKYRVTYNRAGSGCPSASDEVEIKIFPSPSLTSTMDECASTVFSNGNDKWDYIYTIGSAATPTWVVADTTGDAELVYQAPNNNGEGFKIYRIPIGSGSQTFKITDDNGCVVYFTLGRNSSLPTLLPNTVMPGNALGQCYLTGFNEWVHFKKQGSNSEVIASIKDNGVNLGIVTVESYREATSPQIPNSGPTCIGTPVAAMRRHFRITSNLYANPADKFVDGNGSPTNIELQLYFSQADFNDLVSSAAGNNINGNQCTEDDDITTLNSLYLTKYSDYDQLGNEDGDYMNNSTNSAYYRVFNVGNVSNPLVIQQNGFDNIFGTNSSGYHYAALSITEFSEFWLHGSNNGSPLPVEMLFIEAKNINNSYIQINWATATELNNWKFEVERSTDGVNFTKIGEVIGNGTSTDRHDYTYNDKNVVPGIRYYYRLKQIDFDESYEYSPVVSEMLRGDDLFKVSDFVPNPAADQAKLIITTGKEQEVQIEMHNYLGEIVKKGTTYLNKGSNTINFDFADLAAGTYTTRVVAGTNTHVRRVVITR